MSAAPVSRLDSLVALLLILLSDRSDVHDDPVRLRLEPTVPELNFFSSVCGALYQVLTCRIVLNIRDVGSKDTLVGGGGTATQLHSYHSSQPSVMPMVFRAAPKNSTHQSDTVFSENNDTQWA